MDEASILKDLVKFNTIKDKENVEILNYVESILKEMGFSTWHHGKNLVMRLGDTQRLWQESCYEIRRHTKAWLFRS